MSFGNSQTQPTTEAIPHVGYLDALRGIAILGVLAVHCSASSLQTSRISWPFYAGASGVELFYAVSAFTLFLSLDARSREPHATFNFLVRRFFRIAPLFYLTILLNWCRLRLPFVHGYRPTPADYVLGFLFLFGFKPALISTIVLGGWSIAVETTFYVLLPAIHRYVKTLPRAAAAFTLSYAVLIPFSYWLARLHPENLGYFSMAWFPIQLPMFLMGVLLYLVVRSLIASHSAASLRRISALVLIVCTVGFFAKHFHLGGFDPTDYPADVFLVGGPLLALALHPWGILVNPVTRFLGKVSFSVYLLHFFVLETVLKAVERLTHRSDAFLGFTFGTFPSFLAVLALVVPLVLLIATLSWKYIEQPGILAGRRLLKHLSQTRALKANSLLPGTTAHDDAGSAPL